MEALFDIPLSVVPQPWAFVAFVLSSGVLAWASAVDIKRRIVPGGAIAAGVLIWCAMLVFAAALGAVGWRSAPTASVVRECGFLAGVGGAVLSAAFALLLDTALSRATGRAAIGMGDVKLLFVLGLHVGFLGALACLFVACALAALHSCARFAFDAASRFVRPRRRHPGPARPSFDGTFPFVPFLAAAYVAVAAASGLRW